MTINVTLNSIGNLQDTTTAQTNLNANNTAISGGFTTALNVTGDQMQGNLDMNSNQILNLPAPAGALSPVRLMDVTSSSTIASVPPVGTSGAVVGLLNTANTYSGTSVFTAPVTIEAYPNVRALGTATTPAGITSGTAVMMGLAGAFTPEASGNVLLFINGSVVNSIGGATSLASIVMSYGAGSAPANGNAQTGTGVSANTYCGNTSSTPFTCVGYVHGLNRGTAYWFDIALSTAGGGNGVSAISGIETFAMEI